MRIMRGGDMTQSRDNYFNVTDTHEEVVRWSVCGSRTRNRGVALRGAPTSRKERVRTRRGGGESAAAAGVATAFRPNVKSAVCTSDATVMSTNIYLIGCSPAIARRCVMRERSRCCARKKVSLPRCLLLSFLSQSKILRKDKANVGGDE